MILAFVVAYAGAASWAVRTGGHPRLWGAGGLVLLAGGPTSRVPRAVRAMVGAIVGFVCGFLLVVFGLGVW